MFSVPIFRAFVVVADTETGDMAGQKQSKGPQTSTTVDQIYVQIAKLYILSKYLSITSQIYRINIQCIRHFTANF
jgi:hypothetical protein